MKDGHKYKHSRSDSKNQEIPSSRPINIIFLGGSVTEGYKTEYDCQTPLIKEVCDTCNGKYTEGLYRYFQSVVNPALNVSFVLLTGGGWTSEVQADKIIDNLRKEGLVSDNL